MALDFSVTSQDNLRPAAMHFDVAGDAITINLVDSVSMQDSLAALDALVPLNDAVAVSDGGGFDTTLRMGDTIAITDQVADVSLTALFIQLSDSIGITDQLKELGVFVSLTETISVLDRLVEVGESFFIQLVDSISVSDSVGAVDVDIALNDIVSLADTLQPKGVGVHLTDVVAIDDRLEIGVSFTLNDQVNIQDVQNVVKSKTAGWARVTIRPKYFIKTDTGPKVE